MIDLQNKMNNMNRKQMVIFSYVEITVEYATEIIFMIERACQIMSLMINLHAAMVV